MAEVTLARLVQEGVSSVTCMAGDMLPGAVLALDAVTAQVAPFHASFAALDSGHMGDLRLDVRSKTHPEWPRGMGGWSSSWLGHSAAGGETM